MKKVEQTELSEMYNALITKEKKKSAINFQETIMKNSQAKKNHITFKVKEAK